ncbi:histidinol-phosphate transaminase [Aquitalea pelogenes]|uniref:histidinol-phosphate transaminase n=1 Tax=Aquitalea pelogenes TaxID=1293573 RepID=UPI0007893416|nr:histidinol-phosphate transaminase [Aquitalea pelogenes]
MSRFWSPVVHQLTPYVPGEQPKLDTLIKLNTNENPYGPSPRVLEAIRAATDDSLRLYPDPSGDKLKDAIAGYHGVSRPQVFVGNSSDEVLGIVFQALLKHEQPLLMPDISYGFYPVYCGLFGIQAQQVPLDDSLSIRVEDYRQPCGGVILANPNAPTGRLLPLSAIRQLLDDHPDQVVVIDEAYVDFGGETAIALVNDYPNLLVVHTLSKSRSLAGLRVGYAVGDATLIEALERVKNSFNAYPLDRLALAGAVASFEDDDYFRHTCQAVMCTREQLTAQLQALGFEVLPSAANFVFARHPQHDAAMLATGLRQQAVIVRHFTAPRINQYLRISIGTDAECARLVQVLGSLLS